jgi:hypothetical protein
MTRRFFIAAILSGNIFLSSGAGAADSSGQFRTEHKDFHTRWKSASPLLDAAPKGEGVVFT